MKFQVREVNHLGICTDRRLSNEEKENLIEIASDKYGIVDFAESENDYDAYRLDSARYGLFYDIEYENVFLATAKENSGTLYYGESWETKFVWLFFDWFLVEKKCTGQS